MADYREPTRCFVTADTVALTVRSGELAALLVTRRYPPHEGALALPGGFVEPEEDLPEAALRELAEETGVSLPDGAHLEQLRSYGAPGRDPRGRVITVAHLVLAPLFDPPRGGSDAASAQWQPVAPLLSGERPLAFDHREILADGVERARAKLEYSGLAAAFCPPEFTIAQLRAVYEAVWGVALDPRNFHRKVTGARGFIEPTGDISHGEGRPAALFRLASPDPSATVLDPPLTRPVLT